MIKRKTEHGKLVKIIAIALVTIFMPWVSYRIWRSKPVKTNIKVCADTHTNIRIMLRHNNFELFDNIVSTADDGTAVIWFKNNADAVAFTLAYGIDQLHKDVKSDTVRTLKYQNLNKLAKAAIKHRSRRST